MKLYQVSLKVRPSKDHPMFWDIQFGHLHIWTYGENPYDVAERAKIIAEQLPYEFVRKEESWRVKVTDAAEFKKPILDYDAHKKMAMQFGISVGFIGCVTGTEEVDFENADPV